MRQICWTCLELQTGCNMLVKPLQMNSKYKPALRKTVTRFHYRTSFVIFLRCALYIIDCGRRELATLISSIVSSLARNLDTIMGTTIGLLTFSSDQMDEVVAFERTGRGCRSCHHRSKSQLDRPLSAANSFLKAHPYLVNTWSKR